MQHSLTITTTDHESLYDITDLVRGVVSNSDVAAGSVNVFVQGATAAVMIQENWDDSVQRDVIAHLRKQIPSGIWEHDRQDGNGDAHIKAGLVGPSETIPIIDGHLGLGRWQDIFLCEFDGPRSQRSLVVTVMDAAPERG